MSAFDQLTRSPTASQLTPNDVQLSGKNFVRGIFCFVNKAATLDDHSVRNDNSGSAKHAMVNEKG